MEIMAWIAWMAQMAWIALFVTYFFENAAGSIGFDKKTGFNDSYLVICKKIAYPFWACSSWQDALILYSDSGGENTFILLRTF